MDTATKKEPRRLPRFSLTLPVRVKSLADEINGWDEITRLNDISAFGAGFNLKHKVRCGRLLHLTLPLPRQMRCYDYTESQYRIWGLVRSCISRENAPADKVNSIGVAFIGKNPPDSYFGDPNTLYEISETKNDKLWKVVEASIDSEGNIMQKDLRRHSRFLIPTNVFVEKLDVNGNITASEPTVTENISLSGAAIFSMLDAEAGDFVRVKSDQYDVSIISVVRAKRIGPDNIPRLHVEFVDRFFPLEGIE